ncbi:hypothetical protein QUV98_03455 [Massilimicrobiota timonensis]|uniref:Integrase SAM-like N-terminal domain-containing protein n=1 Tax=Massilimicrobiota timonensis TaxID=1776392 RepID=A0ABT7UGV5_9FIRM|nr:MULTISPECIES: hypothetical protein [Massilimicrobiota]MDM8195374.1 hypothetical protein [Massilimicrobiota timonensis]OUQ74525.1 hypothetical protein B5E48_12300 [Massilimicrobiota sp. An105]
MPRKGENIYKRKDGRWEARYIKSHDISGRAKYGYVYGKSYREAKQKQHNALAKLEDSLDTGNNQVVLYKSDVKALSVCWLTSIEPQIKQSTFNKYNNLLASYIVPYLGDIVFAIKGESFRGKRLETISLRMTAAVATAHAESRNKD